MQSTTRLLRRSRGFSLIEAMISAAVLAFILIAALSVFTSSTKSVKNDLKQGTGISAARNVTSIVESMAMYDPSTMNQIVVGKSYPISAGTGSGSSSLVSMTLVDKGTDGAGGVKNYTFSYATAGGARGTVLVPIHRLGTTTDGCDPAHGVTTNCNSYLVPGK